MDEQDEQRDLAAVLDDFQVSFNESVVEDIEARASLLTRGTSRAQESPESPALQPSKVSSERLEDREEPSEAD